jgi:CDGSH iron-sulfur domain-containing protein 3
MSDPVIAARVPTMMELEEGTYWWCKCGKSKNQPWCDGSHAGSEFEPVEITITEKRRYALCQCKFSKKSAFCDGTHKNV